MTETKIKIAPNSKESEMMVLGSMLTSINALNIAADILDDTDFYYTEHKLIFQVLKDAHQNDKPADLHLVCEELKRKDRLAAVGGAAYLTTLAQYAGTSAHIEEYCDILKNRAFSRQAISICEDGEEEFLQDPEDPAKTLEKYSNKFIELSKRYSPNDRVSIGDILFGSNSIDSIPIIEKLRIRQEYFQSYGEEFITGLPTGFKDFDDRVSVLDNTNIIVIAGRPAMGKTACALSILCNICMDQELPVGFISLEMGADQLAERILSIRTGISGEKIKRGTFTEDEFKKLKDEDAKLRSAKFFIHDQAIETVSQVVSRSRRLKDEEDIRILAIDYLQLLGVNGTSDSRQYEVAAVSKTLKALARELKIPIIVVAQLSRKVEERSDKRPLMSDLRDSGQIEQDADAIIFVYRRDYYDKTDKPGQAEFILVKNRHGSTTSVSLSFQSDCGRFGNLSHSEVIDDYGETSEELTTKTNSSKKFQKNNSYLKRV